MNRDSGRKRPVIAPHVFALFLVVLTWICGCNAERNSMPASVFRPGALSVYYFVPADQQPDTSYYARVGALVDSAGRYFNYWMQHWGFDGRMQIRYAGEQPAVERVNGKRGLQYYLEKGGAAIAEELEEWMEKQGHPAPGGPDIIFVCVSDPGNTGRLFSSIGYRAFVTDITHQTEKHADEKRNFVPPAQKRLADVCHELGHALGLPHNWGNGISNKKYGYTLMGPPEEALLERIYLTRADCMILRSSGNFPNGIIPHTYERGTASIRKLECKRGSDSLVIAGTCHVESGVMQSIVVYHDSYFDGFGDNRDYDASSWDSDLDSGTHFQIGMARSDFRHNIDTTCRLKIGICFKEGGTQWFQYEYDTRIGPSIVFQ